MRHPICQPTDRPRPLGPFFDVIRLLPLLLLAACVSPTPDRPPEPAETTESTPDNAAETVLDDGPDLDADDLARRVHRATNAARETRDLRTLAWDDGLQRLALAHSADMARRGFFDHVNPDGEAPNDRAARLAVDCRLDLSGGRVRSGVAENLYQTWRWTGWTEITESGRTTRTHDWQTSAEIADATVQGWLDSPGHRRNLLNADSRAQAVGVAVAPGGEVYLTQILC